MLMSADDSSVVLVDLQHKLMPAIHQGDAVLSRCLRLAGIAKALDVPVVGTEQSPDRLGPNAEEIREVCGQTVVKSHFDACADGLVKALSPQRKTAMVAGCEAHVCILQTALGLMDAGFQVWVVADAVGSRKVSDRDAALSRLRQNGAQIVTVEMVAFEWLGNSNHPGFRDVLKLIK
ncbi:isochorismatase family protein [Marinobacter changyiensis]|uniref:isochorismatase family protein n=1 Tax=Marinobacter changyiensis TaxID=2604091 RepID=UPI0012649D21|nr:isochorismatase family protein [Marinobacter changyiensis]